MLLLKLLLPAIFAPKVFMLFGSDDGGDGGNPGGSVEDADATGFEGNWGDPGTGGHGGDVSYDSDGNAYAYGQYSGYDMNTYGWGDPTVGRQANPDDAATAHNMLSANSWNQQAGEKGTAAWNTTPISEEDFQQMADMQNGINMTDQNAWNNAYSEYQGLGFSGALTDNPWSFSDPFGETHTNWGSIGRDTLDFAGSPAVQAALAATGYGALGAGLSALSGLTSGNYGKAGSVFGGALGGAGGAVVGGILGNYAAGKNASATQTALNAALGLTGNATLNSWAGQTAYNAVGAGTWGTLAGIGASKGASYLTSEALDYAGITNEGRGISGYNSALGGPTGTATGVTDNSEYSAALASAATLYGLTNGGSMATTNDSSNWLGDLASLYAAYQSNQAGTAASNSLDQYNDLLKQTYTDPTSVYNSQYKALDSAFYNDLQAQNAARGRTTDAYKTGVAREAAFQNWLSQYRAGLQGSATGSYQNAVNSANANSQGIYSLANILGTKGSSGKSLGSTLSTGLYEGGSYLYDYLMGTSPMDSVIGDRDYDWSDVSWWNSPSASTGASNSSWNTGWFDDEY